MSYEVISIPKFDKQAKQLAKKVSFSKKDLAGLIESLSAEPKQGSPLGNNFYKLRLAITSKGKGKSGGGRVITYIKVIKAIVYLTTVYDKSEKGTITDQELDDLFKLIP